jgi:hypothetical protein
LFTLAAAEVLLRSLWHMHAVNDWSARNVITPELYLANYRQAWGEDRKSNLSHESQAFYLIDLVSIFRSNLGSQTKVTVTYEQAAQAQAAKKMPPLTEANFLLLQAEIKREFLPNRTALIGRIAEVGRSLGVRIVMVTQPNAFRSDYPSAGAKDRRTYPEWEGKLLTGGQS